MISIYKYFSCKTNQEIGFFKSKTKKLSFQKNCVPSHAAK